MENNFNQQTIMKNNIPSIAISVAIIITALILGRALQNRNKKTTDNLSVTGGSARDFVSDLIVWNASFSRKNIELKDAYKALEEDKTRIKSYLVEKGVPETSIIFSAVSTQKDFQDVTNDEGRRISSRFVGYILQQNVSVESKEVDKVEIISRQITELINSGIELTSTMPQYFYTQLASLKIQMLEEASKDAKLRAEKISSNAGGDLGKLQNSQMGIFQITAQNSSEGYSYGGTFNTDSKKKTATITVKLQYQLD